MSAPNLKEIEWAISELEGKESSESNYSFLAALYTCRKEMLGTPDPPQPQAASAYSEAAAPAQEKLAQYGDSDFLRAVEGKSPAAAWRIMDELMDTLRAVNTRTYESVMRKLGRI